MPPEPHTIAQTATKPEDDETQQPHTIAQTAAQIKHTRDDPTSKPTVANVLAQPLIFSRRSFCVVSMTIVQIKKRFRPGGPEFSIRIPLSHLAWAKRKLRGPFSSEAALKQVFQRLRSALSSQKLHVVIENYLYGRRMRVRRDCIWTDNCNAFLRTTPSSGLDNK